MQTKEEIRSIVRTRKMQASPDDLARDSDIIFRKIIETSAYILAPAVFIYADFDGEVQTRKFIAQALASGKRVALPRCLDDGSMVFCTIDSLRQIEEGKGGVPVPAESCEIDPCASALVIVPGIAFDPKRNRLGRGGGYYDRFLKENPAHTTMGVCFDFQLFDELPKEPHDMRVQMLFTESQRFVQGRSI